MSKKSIFLVVLASFFILLYFIAARTPANLVFSYVEKKTPLISTSNVSGTLWKGSASDITINYAGNVFSLGQSSWDIQTLAFLMGQFNVKVSFVNGEQIIKGTVGVGVSKNISIKDMEIVLDSSLLAKIYPYPGQIDGTLEVNIVEFVFSGLQIKKLDASGVIRNCIYTLNQPVVLGTHSGKLSLVKDKVKAVLSDVDAPITLNGEVYVTPATRDYTLELNITPKETADPILVQTLSGFFKQVEDGSFAFNLESKF